MSSRLAPAQAVQYAHQIYYAVKGLGTDEQALIDVISRNTLEDLQVVSRAFCACYGREIIPWIKGDVSGNFGKLMTQFYLARYTAWATYIHEAIAGLGTDNKVLIELVLTADENDLAAIKAEYFRLYKEQVFEEISDDISKRADWARLLRAWMSSLRFPRNQIEQDADRLFQAGKGAGTDERMFMEILCTTTPQEYLQIMIRFQQKYGKDLRKFYQSELSGKTEYAYLLAHDHLIHPAKAVAFTLYNAMKGLGTRDRTLVKQTVLFRDRYMKEVNTFYCQQFGSLKADFLGDTSCWYAKTLVQVWNCQ
uniref:Annexin 8 n=1 Tax=Spironucleus vortens TaxID=58336 RepID=A0A142C676_SPIVO|nr:annexin 8 [Spironucleus vortens]